MYRYANASLKKAEPGGNRLKFIDFRINQHLNVLRAV